MILLTGIHYLHSPSFNSTVRQEKCPPVFSGQIEEFENSRKSVGEDTQLRKEIEATRQNVENDATPTIKQLLISEQVPETGNSEWAVGGSGKSLYVLPSTAADKNAGVEGCLYPIIIHVTPHHYGTGAL